MSYSPVYGPHTGGSHTPISFAVYSGLLAGHRSQPQEVGEESQKDTNTTRQGLGDSGAYL